MGEKNTIAMSATAATVPGGSQVSSYAGRTARNQARFQGYRTYNKRCKSENLKYIYSNVSIS